MAVELRSGGTLLRQTAAAAAPADAQRLNEWALLLESPVSMERAVAVALGPELTEIMPKYPDRSLSTTYHTQLAVAVDRPRAVFSTWYELFPRSFGRPGEHGTFQDCERLLPDIAAMGFDVLYLPPIHPIGQTHRKVRNNFTSVAPADPGSPWAIGSTLGGHKALHPQLGSFEDFQHLVRKAAEYGLETAMDLAFQASPDHPYVKEHPEWFRWRPDGTVQFAENPPKKYEDILPQYLQFGGRPAFIVRLILAATLSASYGIYGPAYELGITEALEGKEEYLNSEKCEIKQWDWNARGNLRPIIERVNRIRRQNPSLQSIRNIELYPIDNEAMLCYGKTTEDKSNIIITVVNIDPHHRQFGWLRLPLERLEIDPRMPFLAHDLLTDDRYIWQGEVNYVELDPRVMPAHILRVQRRLRREMDFDYFM